MSYHDVIDLTDDSAPIPTKKSYLKEPQKHLGAKKPELTESRIFKSLMTPGSISSRLQEITIPKNEIYIDEIEEFKEPPRPSNKFETKNLSDFDRIELSNYKVSNLYLKNLRDKPQPPNLDSLPFLYKPPTQVEGFKPRLFYQKEADYNALDRLLK